MKLTIITLFPEIFDPVLNASILKRAQQKGLVEFELINLRGFGEGPHKTVDNRPFGGGPGMILKADVLARALKSTLERQDANLRQTVILTSAAGKPYNQDRARELSGFDHIVIVCGHYEGVDERFVENYVDEELSIGDFILTGGEVAAMAIVDSITRLVPGVLKKEEATLDESFEGNLLEHPQYTRPINFESHKVPEVLLTGNHAKIKQWRLRKSREKTRKNRPDLLKR